MTQLQSIVQANVPYINGLGFAWTSTTTLTVSAGSCSDSNTVVNMVLSSATVLNAAVSGLNGLDTGALAASSLYHIFIVSDSRGINPTGLLLSLSATAPYLPSVPNQSTSGTGYDSFRRIGAIATDSGSLFLLGYQTSNLGTNASRPWYFDSKVSVLAAGNATSATAVSLVALMPVQSTEIQLNAAYTPATAGNAASFSVVGSSATLIETITGAVAAVAQTVALPLFTTIASSAPKFTYKVGNSSDALTLWLCGYVDNL